MENRVTVLFVIHKRHEEHELSIPLDISANDLVSALSSAYNLGIQTQNIKNCYLQSENPIALLKGNKTMEEFGIRNGSRINYTR